MRQLISQANVIDELIDHPEVLGQILAEMRRQVVSRFPIECTAIAFEWKWYIDVPGRPTFKFKKGIPSVPEILKEQRDQGCRFVYLNSNNDERRVAENHQPDRAIVTVTPSEGIQDPSFTPSQQFRELATACFELEQRRADRLEASRENSIRLSTCIFASGSGYLKCAVNPTEECRSCSHYEAK